MKDKFITDLINAWDEIQWCHRPYVGISEKDYYRGQHDVLSWVLEEMTGIDPNDNEFDTVERPKYEVMLYPTKTWYMIDSGSLYDKYPWGFLGWIKIDGETLLDFGQPHAWDEQSLRLTSKEYYDLWQDGKIKLYEWEEENK